MWTMCLVVVMVVSRVVPAIAQSGSSNYRVDESSFSSGSGSGASASYSAQGSAGDNGIGFAYSTGYTAYAGPVSPDEEYLEMVVSATTINLDTPSSDPGVLTAAETATGTAQFYVRAYMNSSYAVLTLSSTMTNESGDTIQPLTATSASTAGVEQFGINLVDNGSPDIGSNPALQPNASFANGEAAPGYSTVNQFKYAQGDTVARNGNDPAWGQTNYTISYIANISSITEAGFYQMVHQLTAVPTF